jgi:outer membrane protein
MKKIGLILLLAIFCIFVANVSFAAKDVAKIGYVDLGRLFDEYYKTKEFDKILEGKQKDFESKRNEKLELLRESQGKLALLKDDKKATMEEDIAKIKADLLEFDKQGKADLTKERNEKIREILLEIEKIVSDFAQKEGYTVILNDRVLIYGEQSMDVTEYILKVLNDVKK